MKNVRGYLRSVRGMSLISTLVGVGLVSVIVGVMTSLLLRLGIETRENRVVQARDQLNNYMSMVLMNKRSIDNSLAVGGAANKDLATCLNGSANPADKCVALDGASQPQKTPFVLYPPNSANPASGALGTPMYFSDNGTACTSGPSEACPLSVQTWFVADCGGAADCASAVDVNFFYEVKREVGNAIRPGTNADLPMAWSTLNRAQGDENTATAASTVGDGSGVSCFHYNVAPPAGGPVCCVNRSSQMNCWRVDNGAPFTGGGAHPTPPTISTVVNNVWVTTTSWCCDTTCDYYKLEPDPEGKACDTLDLGKTKDICIPMGVSSFRKKTVKCTNVPP